MKMSNRPVTRRGQTQSFACSPQQRKGPFRGQKEAHALRTGVIPAPEHGCREILSELPAVLLKAKTPSHAERRNAPMHFSSSCGTDPPVCGGPFVIAHSDIKNNVVFLLGHIPALPPSLPKLTKGGRHGFFIKNCCLKGIIMKCYPAFQLRLLRAVESPPPITMLWSSIPGCRHSRAEGFLRAGGRPMGHAQ